ncbi:MAG: DUF1573 domain-containing protein [Lacipirellulaceae bacterium]
MPRLLAAAFFALCLPLATAAVGQPWAAKMFDKLDHDFGVVARGSDTVYRFEVKNIFKEDVEVASVRSSCGCTTPTIENGSIKTYEKAYVVATFNTRTFTGPHSATLTVQITKPYPAQIQLRVHGNIRGDVVFEPGSVDFESLNQGESREKTLSIVYAGRSDWRIDDVRSVNDSLEAELVERGRMGGKVSYDLVVRLLPTAKSGFLSEQLVLVTNDLSNPRVPIDVVGKVNAALTVAPEHLVLGDVEQGKSIKKKLLVRCDKPFRVTAIRCDDARFTCSAGDKESNRQMVSVEFASTGAPGRLMAPITIETSLGGSYTTSAKAYATVVAAPEPEAPASATTGAGAEGARTADASGP